MEQTQGTSCLLDLTSLALKQFPILRSLNSACLSVLSEILLQNQEFKD